MNVQTYLVLTNEVVGTIKPQQGCFLCASQLRRWLETFANQQLLNFQDILLVDQNIQIAELS